MIITVVGMGKIGLPLAAQFASKGHQIIGADINQRTVDLINEGRVPFPGEPGLDSRIEDAVATGLLSATTDTADATSKSDVVVVVVPLFVDVDGQPDFGWMDSATQKIGQGLKAGTLVSYETTLPVGTTRTRFSVALEAESGLVAGEDFFVAFSPERVLTGRVFEDLRKYPKLIGGINSKSANAARLFYESVLDFDDRPDLARANGVWDLGSSEASEMAKLAETTYRDVNIGLANQFARFADHAGIDVYAVIDACNSQFYSHIHRPGIAVGGHCIPIYPQMYLWNDPEATVVRAARAANRGMPAYAVSVLRNHMAGLGHGDSATSLSGCRVAVLGAAYRGGVKETAFSGVFDVVNSLIELDAEVVVHDPMYSDDEIAALGFTPYHLGEPVDAVIVQADHREYASLSETDFPGAHVIVDGRRIISPALAGTIPTLVIGSVSADASSRALPQ